MIKKKEGHRLVRGSVRDRGEAVRVRVKGVIKKKEGHRQGRGGEGDRAEEAGEGGEGMEKKRGEYAKIEGWA